MQVSIILKDEQISSKIYRYLKWLSIKSQVFEDTQSMLKWFKDNEDAEDTVALINSNVNPNEIPKHIEPLVISDSVDALRFYICTYQWERSKHSHQPCN